MSNQIRIQSVSNKPCLPPELTRTEMTAWWIRKYNENNQPVSIPYVVIWIPDKREWCVNIPITRITPTMTPEELSGFQVLGEALAPGDSVLHPNLLKGFHVNRKNML